MRQYSLLIQYNETDLDFATASSPKQGRFEHCQGATAGYDVSHAWHRLVLLDSMSEPTVCAQPEIRFHCSNATEDGDNLVGVLILERNWKN